MAGWGSGLWGGSGGTDPASAPTVTVVSPPTGVVAAPFSLASETPVVIDVTSSSTLALVVVTVKMALNEETDVIHDGTSFVWPYNTDASTKQAISGGFRFTMIPREGWNGDITSLKVYAVDQFGNHT